MNNVLLITCVSRGIDLAVAKALYQRGYILSLGVRNSTALNAVFSTTSRVLTAV